MGPWPVKPNTPSRLPRRGGGGPAGVRPVDPPPAP